MRDASNQEIVPIQGKKLEVHTNRHTTTRGELWGWISGCTKNIVWGNDSSSFNKEAAEKFVREYNAEQEARAKRPTLSERLRDPEQYVDACDEAAQVLDDTLTILKKYRQVVKVLGAGVGNLPLTADFFALWNETEISVNLLVKLLEGNKEQTKELCTCESSTEYLKDGVWLCGFCKLPRLIKEQKDG